MPIRIISATFPFASLTFTFQNQVSLFKLREFSLHTIEHLHKKVEVQLLQENFSEVVLCIGTLLINQKLHAFCKRRTIK